MHYNKARNKDSPISTPPVVSPSKHKGAVTAGETATHHKEVNHMNAKEELIRYIQSLTPEQLAKITRGSSEIIKAVKEVNQ